MAPIGKPEKIIEVEESPAIPNTVPSEPAPAQEPVKTPEKVPA